MVQTISRKKVDYNLMIVYSLYKRLMDFKNDPEFLKEGFIVDESKYCKWFDDMRVISEGLIGQDILNEYSFDVYDLGITALGYIKNGGQETVESAELHKSIIRLT